MPELPEVETIRQRLALGLHGDAPALGRTLVAAPVTSTRTVRTGRPDQPAGAGEPPTLHGLIGRRLHAIERRAKLLLLRFDEVNHATGAPLWLLVHLRMTGELVFVPAATPPAPAERFRLVLDDGRAIAFCAPAEMGELRAIEKSMKAKIPVVGGEPPAEAAPAARGPQRRGKPAPAGGQNRPARRPSRRPKREQAKA